LKIDIMNSRLIPFMLIVLVSTRIFIDFFAVGMFFLSYATQAGALLAFMIAMELMLRKKTITHFDLTNVLFLLLIGYSSLMNGSDWKNWTYISVSVISYLVVISYFENQYKVIVIAALVVLSVGVYAQFLQCIPAPMILNLGVRLKLTAWYACLQMECA